MLSPTEDTQNMLETGTHSRHAARLLLHCSDDDDDDNDDDGNASNGMPRTLSPNRPQGMGKKPSPSPSGESSLSGVLVSQTMRCSRKDPRPKLFPLFSPFDPSP